MNVSTFKKLTKKMVRTAFSSEEGMDKLVDKLLEMTTSNAQFENQVKELLGQISTLNNENRVLKEENTLLQKELDKLLP